MSPMSEAESGDPPSTHLADAKGSLELESGPSETEPVQDSQPPARKKGIGFLAAEQVQQLRALTQAGLQSEDNGNQNDRNGDDWPLEWNGDDRNGDEEKCKQEFEERWQQQCKDFQNQHPNRSRQAKGSKMGKGDSQAPHLQRPQEAQQAPPQAQNVQQPPQAMQPQRPAPRRSEHGKSDFDGRWQEHQPYFGQRVQPQMHGFSQAAVRQGKARGRGREMPSGTSQSSRSSGSMAYGNASRDDGGSSQGGSATLRRNKWINRQVTRSADTGNLQGLLQTVQFHISEMNGINLATALHRVTKLAVSGQTGTTTVQLLAHPSFQLLRSTVMKHIDMHKPKPSIGGCNMNLDDSSEPLFEVQCMSIVCWSCATLRLREEKLMGKIADIVLPCLGELKPFELANMLWAYAKLSLGRPPLLAAVSDRMLKRHKLEFSMQCLSMIAWSFATEKHRDAAVFSSIASEIVTDAPATKPQEIANTLWAYAKNRCQDLPLFNALADTAISDNMLWSFKPQELSNTVWAFATVSLQHVPLFKHAVAIAMGKRHELSPQNIANILWAYAKLQVCRKSASGLFPALLSVSVGMMPQHKPHEISAIVWAAAKENVPACRRFFGATAQMCAQRLHEFPPQALANMVEAFAVIKSDSPSFSEAMARESIGRLHQFDPMALSNLFRGVALATRRARSAGSSDHACHVNVLGTICTHIVSRMGEMQPCDLGHVKHSLRLLGPMREPVTCSLNESLQREAWRFADFADHDEGEENDGESSLGDLPGISSFDGFDLDAFDEVRQPERKDQSINARHGTPDGPNGNHSETFDDSVSQSTASNWLDGNFDSEDQHRNGRRRRGGHNSRGGRSFDIDSLSPDLDPPIPVDSSSLSWASTGISSNAGFGQPPGPRPPNSGYVGGGGHRPWARYMDKGQGDSSMHQWPPFFTNSNTWDQPFGGFPPFPPAPNFLGGFPGWGSEFSHAPAPSSSSWNSGHSASWDKPWGAPTVPATSDTASEVSAPSQRTLDGPGFYSHDPAWLGMQSAPSTAASSGGIVDNWAPRSVNVSCLATLVQSTQGGASRMMAWEILDLNNHLHAAVIGTGEKVVRLRFGVVDERVVVKRTSVCVASWPEQVATHQHVLAPSAIMSTGSEDRAWPRDGFSDTSKAGGNSYVAYPFCEHGSLAEWILANFAAGRQTAPATAARIVNGILLAADVLVTAGRSIGCFRADEIFMDEHNEPRVRLRPDPPAVQGSAVVAGQAAKWLAPEEVNQDAGAPPSWPAVAFRIGLLLYCIGARTPDPYPHKRGEFVLLDLRRELAGGSPVRPHLSQYSHSEQLFDLMKACLSSQPSARPDQRGISHVLASVMNAKSNQNPLRHQ